MAPEFKIDFDRLQDSLEYIKTVCEEAGSCKACPLGGKEGICKLSISPTEWSVRHPEYDPFRVLE